MASRRAAGLAAGGYRRQPMAGGELSLLPVVAPPTIPFGVRSARPGVPLKRTICGVRVTGLQCSGSDTMCSIQAPLALRGATKAEGHDLIGPLYQQLFIWLQ
jgi:hypothetical protein